MASSSSIGQYLRTASLWSRPANTASNTARTQTGAASTSGTPSKADPSQGGSTQLFLSLASLRQSLTEQASKSQASGLLELAKALPNIRASRKNAARERLAQLKAQIEALQKFFIASGGQSSKAMAALLKTLASELKSVAAELSQSDGGGSSADTAAVVTLNVDSSQGDPGTAGAGTEVPTNDASHVPTDSSAGETGAAAAGADAAAADEAAAVAADAADDTAGAGTAETDEAGDRDGKAAGAGAQPQASGTTRADAPSNRAMLAVQRLGTSSSSDGASAADKAMLADVAGKLKALIAMVKAQLHGTKNKDLEHAEASLKEALELASH
jgi:hypothetical protein